METQERGLFCYHLAFGFICGRQVKKFPVPSAVKFVYVKTKTQDLELLAKWLNKGLETPIDSTLPVRELPEGFKRFQTGNHLGRIVVDVADQFLKRDKGAGQIKRDR